MTMTTIKVQAPPCPSWCIKHDPFDDGAVEHLGAAITVDVPDWERIDGRTVTFEVVPIQWERWDPEEGTISREVGQVRLRIVESTWAPMYLSGGADAARRVGEALVKAAQTME